MATPTGPSLASDAATSSPDPSLDGGLEFDASVEQQDSFEAATRLTPDTQILVDEKSSDQVDYFVFSGEAGEFYEIKTSRERFSPDNVITLYNPQRQAIAENDDNSLWPGDEIDARLVVRLPASGDYFVRVVDPFTPPEFFVESSLPLLYYTLSLRRVTAETPDFVFGVDSSPTSIKFAEDSANGYLYTTLVGEFGTTEDAFSFEAIEQQVLVGHVAESGEVGNGSSALGGTVSISTLAPRPVARIDRELGQAHFHPPVTSGLYQMIITPGQEPGSNAFYSVDLVLLPDNPREANEQANGLVAGAEKIDMRGSFQRRGLLLSRLTTDDVDYYQFQTVLGGGIDITCEAASGGSGIRGLQAALVDDSDRVLEIASETPVSNLRLESLVAGYSGTHYLRLSVDPNAERTDIEPWVRCVVFASP